MHGEQFRYQLPGYHVSNFEFCFSRERVSLKNLTLEQKLKVVAGDAAFTKDFILTGQAAIMEVAQNNADVRDAIVRLAQGL